MASAKWLLFCLGLNELRKSEPYMDEYTRPSLVQTMACCLFQHQAITWTNDNILLIRPLETYFNEMLIRTIFFQWNAF